jgi:hypothetical protein
MPYEQRTWWIANADTGEVVHPHPMFSSWADQVHHFCERTAPDRVNYTAVDSSGLIAFCGKRGALEEPTFVIELAPPLVVLCALREAH